MPYGLPPALPADLLRPNPQRLDHGVLNIPGRTGSINAELDRYKASQQRKAAADARARTTAAKAARAEAKALLVLHEAGMVAKHGAQFGAAALKAKLKSMAHFEPEALVKMLAKFAAEQEVSA